MKIGIIGTGNMGRILAEAMLDGKAVSPSSLIITNRTLSKAIEIKAAYEEIIVKNSAFEVAKQSDAVFICVKPHDVYGVLEDILPVLSPDKCVISITSPISTEQLERVVPCSVARAIPSITNRALAGVILITFGKHCDEKWKRQLYHLFSTFSEPVEIENEITRVASDIVSCGPAFFSYLTRRFISAAVKETEIPEETAVKLASEMLVGLGELLKKRHYSLQTLQEKVCVKGGITGEGIKILENELGEVFEHLFQATHVKFEEDLEKINRQFPNQINSA
ncbi:late competence protein ComER [Bacillus methanolicus]|uniref:late competence protein ComER n=1 Tax=Bacillus methanolicus TaxID=1471 RepID=UPI0023809B99|nr:late competence protein ComER [Bacillus methanolicus]MDE3839682.1 late competence protein ComER [Bacillus methanolicus]